ncbi:MAG TPA: DoxX-like family protein [Hanamia sp.]|nr:DoxX-like family protein [Hanamia sp.]
MTTRRKHQLLTCLIAFVWIVNGLFCKVCNLVPRHQEIVAAILGSSHSRLFTLLIGLSEMVMAVWIVSGLWSRFNAITQIVVVVVMNALEFFLVPNLLLWGKFNALWAFLFIVLIYYNEFYLNKKLQPA